jgi:hypothetical protein
MLWSSYFDRIFSILSDFGQRNLPPRRPLCRSGRMVIRHVRACGGPGVAAPRRFSLRISRHPGRARVGGPGVLVGSKLKLEPSFYTR